MRVKVELAFSQEFTGEWTDQEQKTESKETTRTMKLGQVCAWSNYQMFIDCESNVDVGKFTIFTTDGQQKYNSMNNVCTQYNTDSQRAAFVRGQGYAENVVSIINKVCKDVLFSPTSTATVDFTDGARNGNAWSVQGCMWS
jgi:hypothetical protein